MRAAYQVLFFGEGEFRARARPSRGRVSAADPLVGKIIAFIRAGKRPLTMAVKRSEADERAMSARAGRRHDGPLAMICGGGSLPLAVADLVTARGRAVCYFRLRGARRPGD